MNLMDIKKKFELDELTFKRLFVRARTQINKAITYTKELTDSEYSLIVQLIERIPRPQKEETEPKEQPSPAEERKEEAAAKKKVVQPKLKKEKEEKLLEEKKKSVEAAEAKGKAGKKKARAEEKGAAAPAEVPAKKPGKSKKLTKEQLRELERQRREEKRERELRAQFMRSLLIPKKKKKKKKAKATEKVESNIKKVPSGQTVSTLAEIIGVEPAKVIEKLMEMGELATINQQLDDDVAYTVASEFGVELEFVNPEELLEKEEEEVSEKNLVPRAPIVTVMGHVDHGKTTLLDAIRETRVAESEVGGITQKIGAYQVEVDGRKITFIDTPGHEAFTSMRARGAKVTDIVILVVAADDGVKPQTIEAINHAKAAKVPIIVAINKIDKEGVNIDLVKNQLSEHDLVPEDWGGDVPCVNISAKNKIGLDDLLEYIILQADILELKADPTKKATGIVLESRMDKGRGPVATVIVQNGTLRKGDSFVCGNVYGKVRLLIDDIGNQITEAGPSTPVEIVGFEELPVAGDKLEVVENEKRAKEIVEKRKELIKTAKTTGAPKPTIDLDQFLAQPAQEKTEELNVVIKGDVMGSVEAIIDSLMKLSTPEREIKVIHSGVGAVNESDVMLAKASNAIIIAFSTSINPKARELIEKEKVEVKQYKIIYELLEDIQKIIKGMEEPTFKENILGYAEVRQVFSVSKVGKVAGCYVRDGVIRRNAFVRVIRNDVVVHEGTIKSLRRFKEDVREVTKGYECGISIENFSDVHEGDILEVYERVEA